MNNLKVFDKTQFLILILALASFATSIIFSMVMIATGTPVVEDGVVKEVIYNPALQALYSFFVFGHFLGLTWFLGRLITYKLRKKEADLLS